MLQMTLFQNTCCIL